MAKFLLVENDPLVIRIIRHLFNPEGVDTLTVVNSREQLKSELQQDEPVAAALADIHLPDALNGEATKDLLNAGIATVILTGSEDTSARDQWLREGAVDYINKEGRYWYPYATRLLKQLQLNQKRKILIVEDSLVEMESMAAVLELNRYSVIKAESSEQALDILQRDPDIRLMTVDHQLPGMNGLELIQTIRYKFPDRPMSIIGVSAVPRSSAQLSMDFIRSGADDFLHKPFNLQEFIYRINNNAQMIDAYVQLKNQAEQDFLTGLYNRRYFMHQAEDLINKTRSQMRKTMVSMDIDHFKKVNDHFGHHAGDLVLQAVARAMHEELAPLLLARTGGEEFSVLIPAHSAAEVQALMENLRQRIAALKIDVEDGDILSVTISIGACTSMDQDLNTLWNTADEALYSAKLNGRNQVVSLSA